MGPRPTVPAPDGSPGEVTKCTTVLELRLAVSTTPMTARITGSATHIPQQLPRPLRGQLRDRLHVDARPQPIQLRQAGHDAVPPQQLQEPIRTNPLGGDTDLVHELVHERTR